MMHERRRRAVSAAGSGWSAGKPGRRSGWSSCRTAAVAAALAVGLAACTGSTTKLQSTAPIVSQPSESAPTASALPGRASASVQQSPTRTFTDRQLRFDYDRSWVASTRPTGSTMSTPIVYLSSQPTHNPCVTTSLAGGGTRIDCGSPISALDPGGALISWYSAGLPGARLSAQPGQPTTVGGHPAQLASGAPDAECVLLGGRRSVDATIDPEDPGAGSPLIHMDACLNQPAQTVAVLMMLRSVVFPTPPGELRVTSATPTFPTAADGLCQPLAEHRQPSTSSGPLPAPSTVVAAGRCENYLGRDGFGIQFRQSTGSVAALNRALHEKSVSTLPPGISACAASATGAILGVLDQRVRLLRPAWPTTPCGSSGEVSSALAATAYRIRPLPGAARS